VAQEVLVEEHDQPSCFSEINGSSLDYLATLSSIKACTLRYHHSNATAADVQKIDLTLPLRATFNARRTYNQRYIYMDAVTFDSKVLKNNQDP
jgi:hypothetical protein